MAGDFDTKASSLIPNPDTTTAQVITAIYDKNSPEAFYNQLVALLNDCDKHLGDDHEVAVKLANFSQTDALYLSSLHYNSPFLITFILTDQKDNQDFVLIQHINQVSILLSKLPLRDSKKPKQKNRFGFQPNQSPNS
jgi:hypothetical protein